MWLTRKEGTLCSRLSQKPNVLSLCLDTCLHVFFQLHLQDKLSFQTFSSRMSSVIFRFYCTSLNSSSSLCVVLLIYIGPWRSVNHSFMKHPFTMNNQDQNRFYGVILLNYSPQYVPQFHFFEQSSSKLSSISIL